MFKNALIGILVIALVAEGGLLMMKSNRVKQVLGMSTVQGQVISPSPTPARARPTFLTKGMKLADSPISQYAYKIAPGEMSDEAKAALNGFKISSTTAKDGSIQVSLTPTDSYDQRQQYTVKPGNSLYFIEMTTADDKNSADANLRDDYGVIVDANGVVQ